MVSPTEQDFLQFKQALHESQLQWLAALDSASNWQDKYRAILMAGKALPKCQPEWRTDSALVEGCESQAWMHHKLIAGEHHFILDADARIIRGLMGLMLCALESQEPSNQSETTLADWMQRHQLENHLSPSRANGLIALAESIQQAITNP
ncbi:SufE family protein [Paraferrimonas sedimenticola]|uniref:Cysteine desulfurase, sulfur acceptor subunit CsdE n=1 Tax=Paraferrimonas sedimenticola TaxID=375674 RepID=A0AA37RYI0_9GAMM|nr:SufE family protein [Paraferrimonas sedimenticola]GLP97274.1 cysteine desulfurase, sulfur acceptor subunit CsdE [Paraferrimonas sedimenticola]